MSETSITAKIADIHTSRDKLRAKFTELGISDSTSKLSDIADAADSIVNCGSISESVKEGEIYKVPRGYHSGDGTVSGTVGIGSYALQQKTVVPSKNQQSVTPDSGYYGLSGVTVSAIPDVYQNVSAVTATSQDVLSGKIIVSSTGSSVAGAMKNNGSVTAVIDGLESSDVTIPAGYTTGGIVSLSNNIERLLAEI